MNLAHLSIKRPIFVTCIATLILVMGYLSFRKLPVDLFPNITFPIITVNTIYAGAGPVEVETLISKVLEEEISTLPGIKALRSINREGLSTVVAEFTLETDVKYAEQQIRDRVSSVRRKLPDDAQESVIRRIDPADQPILIISLTADLPPAEKFALADDVVKTKIEQIPQVGLVEVLGGRKREIQVKLDRDKLKSAEISASQVANRIASAGQNIPAGKVEEGRAETVFRTLGEFKTIDDIRKTVVNFLGNDVPVTVANVGEVHDGLTDEVTRSYHNGDQALFLMVFRQSGSNTVQVVDAVRKRIDKLNDELKSSPGTPSLKITRDGSWPIHANIDDVKESIMIGIIMTILVVYFFLGSGRSTFITGLALPNSLVGAFLLMSVAGFTINVMSLLALSLAVGLLIDDAIVVRENIFRHVELGKKPIEASIIGTNEVMLAVIATTMAVIAVFGPIGFLKGVVGQFFKEFGLTICFAMAISLFDALTMAPMLSAYFAGSAHGAKESRGLWGMTMGRVLRGFDKLQTWLEHAYGKTLEFILRFPSIPVLLSIAVFVGSIFIAKAVPKTFLPPQDTGEFSVSLELPPGTNLQAMDEVARKVDEVIRANKEVISSTLFVGSRNNEANVATFFVNLVKSKERTMNTSQFKEMMREQLKPFADAKPIVKDIDMVAGGQRPFNINIIGSDLKEIEEVSYKLFEMMKKHPGVIDPEISDKPGKPEFQVNINNLKAQRLGVSTVMTGAELRTMVEGATPAVFREKGEEFDIRVRLKEDQRNLQQDFTKISIPNINYNLVRLANVAEPITTTGPATINRQDRGRYIQIAADISPTGPGMGGVMEDIKNFMETQITMPQGVRYAFVGQAENFKELGESMVMAAILGILFIYMVLASLYESVVTPLTIMLVLPLAICGAFYALYFTGSSLDIFSMIGCVMLLGIATKNSILLVDYTNQLVQQGMERNAAVVEAGKVRLRPILMTTIALIAGMLPIAIGLNEASKQRTSMGIAVIGGLISSTALSLVVVPAAYSYIDRYRVWSGKLMKRIFSPGEKETPKKAA